MTRPGYVSLALGLLIALAGVPSWAALLVGVAVALATGRAIDPSLKPWTSRLLQGGVVALGAGMELPRVLQVGVAGLGTTATSLALTLGLSHMIGRWLRVDRDTSLLLGVGTAICGGSAIASVGSVTKPSATALSISLAVVFMLNGLALLLFPPLGHALNMSQEAFGQWAALAIHDTSSVVGAGLAYGPVALDIATTTKLARALWIAPVTIGVALWQARGSRESLAAVKWPWFIVGFVLMAALFSLAPGLSSVQGPVVALGRKLLVLSLYLVGLGLSRPALTLVGWRPLAQGALTWTAVSVLTAWWVLH